MSQWENGAFIRKAHQRVVITGMAAITPVGHTLASTWRALKDGRSGIARLTLFDAPAGTCQLGGELKEFDPAQFLPRKKLRHMTLASQLSVIAAGQALQDAALDLEQEACDQIGVLLGTAGGSTIEETERATLKMVQQERSRPSPFEVIRLWSNMSSFFVAQEYQVRGYNGTISTACASATQAIGEAAEVIRRGEAEVMITGGMESILSDTIFAGFTAMRALPTGYNDDPERAMRPFDANREGFVPAQGGAILLLESLAHAQARGARIYAEVLGHGNSSDAYHMIAPDPTGEGTALAVRRALKSAGVGADAVDYINAHGSSTPLGDLAETRAFKAVFGARAYDIPVNSTKSMVGHMLGATGAVEAMACVMSLQEGIIHPTVNYETPDPECDLDYVPNEARRANVKVALSNSAGLGGQNACLVLGQVNI
jgi:3-oxoacyl-[acyl-carrier-protein] synthase II